MLNSLKDFRNICVCLVVMRRSYFILCDQTKGSSFQLYTQIYRITSSPSSSHDVLFYDSYIIQTLLSYHFLYIHFCFHPQKNNNCYYFYLYSRVYFLVLYYYPTYMSQTPFFSSNCIYKMVAFDIFKLFIILFFKFSSERVIFNSNHH